MPEEKQEFVVKDRRMFSQDEDASEERNMKTDDSPPPKEEPPSQKKEEDAEASMEEDKDYPLPEINFPTFIFSLSSSVYVQLGFIEDPGTGKKQKNLPLAKQTIDILGMLEEKTRGNLTKEEENMLKNILYDLRMLYIREKE